jgi:microcystin degradation protein MlrC
VTESAASTNDTPEAAAAPLRCYIAGVQHESSSFSPIPTELRSFEVFRWGVDPEPRTLGFGYGESCRVALDLGFDLVTGPFSSCQPSLPAPQRVWEQVREGILQPLRDAGSVDIVWLCLHGAQMSDQEDDCEGDLLERVRELVGDDVAVGCLLDLHTNLSARMLEAADLVVSCRQYPHTDYDERAAEMLPQLARIRRGEIRPTTAAVRFMAPGIYPTMEEPIRSLVERFTEAQRRPGVVQVSLNHGFEGSDQPDMSSSVVVTTDGDRGAAEAMARSIGEDVLATILSQTWKGPGVAASVESALAVEGRPVVIADRADNAGGGAAGDSTFLLAELLRRGVTDAAVALIWDPIAVDFCHAAGVGARIPLRVGGKCGPMSGDPLDLVVEVRSVRTDATQALFGKGEPLLRLGRTAAVHVDGIDIVMSAVRTQVFSHHVFSQHDIDHLDRKILVVKSTQHFMNDFGKFAAAVVRCDGPGTMTADLASLPFRRIQRPLLGLDPVERVELEMMPSVTVRERSGLPTTSPSSDQTSSGQTSSSQTSSSRMAARPLPDERFTSDRTL